VPWWRATPRRGWFTSQTAVRNCPVGYQALVRKCGSLIALSVMDQRAWKLLRQRRRKLLQISEGGADLAKEMADTPRGRGAPFLLISSFYNPRRKHSALGWKSPIAVELRAA
jgi:transposase InsO family protein